MEAEIEIAGAAEIAAPAVAPSSHGGDGFDRGDGGARTLDEQVGAVAGGDGLDVGELVFPADDDHIAKAVAAFEPAKGPCEDGFAAEEARGAVIFRRVVDHRADGGWFDHRAWERTIHRSIHERFLSRAHRRRHVYCGLAQDAEDAARTRGRAQRDTQRARERESEGAAGETRLVLYRASLSPRLKNGGLKR